MIWLHMWQWKVLALILGGSLGIAVLGGVSGRMIGRRPHERWGTTVAGAGVRLGIAAAFVALVVLCFAAGSARGVSKLR